jgi:hypothetical protein
MRKEIATVCLSAIILSLAAAYQKNEFLFHIIISFIIILGINVAIKKIVAYKFGIDIKTKFWSLYQYGLRKDMHLGKPLPMAWLPLLLTLLSKGGFLWLGILEFDTKARPERAAKRHGIYRFTEITEWHVAWIVTWAIIANFAIAIIAYIAGFELFTKLSIYFIFWATIPIGRLDGTKLYFASRALWTTIFALATIALAGALII